MRRNAERVPIARTSLNPELASSLISASERRRVPWAINMNTDASVGRGVGHRLGEPIEDGEPRQGPQVVGPVEQFGGETAEHRSTISRDEGRARAALMGPETLFGAMPAKRTRGPGEEPLYNPRDSL
jgi:hypothetical protein